MSHPAHFVALGFGVGLAPVAPGTFGTLLSVGLYWALATIMPPLAIAFCAIPLFFVGVWACGRTGRDLGVADHGAMVWDEVVAFLPLAALASASLVLQALAFALFRLFDIWKPFPARESQVLTGGVGVMVDDLIAGFYALVLVMGALMLFPGLGARP